MSEKEFQEARGDLSFSQKLVDDLRAQNMAQQSDEMGMEEDVSQETVDEPQETMPEESPQEEVVEQEPVEKEDEKDEVGLLSSFMDEVRALFKSKEEEEKKTQELVEKHNKDMDDIKKGLTDLISDDKES